MVGHWFVGRRFHRPGSEGVVDRLRARLRGRNRSSGVGLLLEDATLLAADGFVARLAKLLGPFHGNHPSLGSICFQSKPRTALHALQRPANVVELVHVGRFQLGSLFSSLSFMPKMIGKGSTKQEIYNYSFAVLTKPGISGYLGINRGEKWF